MRALLFAYGLFTLIVVGCLSAAIKDMKEKKLYCTDKDDPQFRLAIGEQGPSPKGCMLIKCEAVVQGKSVLQAIGCGVFVARSGCNITDYDNSKQYPDCCPNEIC